MDGGTSQGTSGDRKLAGDGDRYHGPDGIFSVAGFCFCFTGLQKLFRSICLCGSTTL